MASHNKKLIFDTLAYGLQGVLPQILAFLLLPVFTAVLTPEDYAAVNLAVVLAGFAAGIAHLQIPAIISRFFFDCQQEEVPSLFSAVFLLTGLVSSSVVGVLTFFGQPIVDWAYPKSNLDFFPLFFLAFCSIVITALVRVCSMLLQVRKKATTLLRVSILVAIVHFSSSILYVVVLDMGPTGVLLAIVTSGLTNLALLSYAVRNFFTLQLDWSFFKPGMQYCLPLIPHIYGTMLFVSSDKIILEKFVPLADVGVYSVAAKMAAPLLIIVEAFNRSISPRFMESSKVSKEATTLEFRTIITKWFAFIMVVWVAFSFFSTEAVLLMTPTSYHGANIFLPILACSYIFRGLYCFCVNPLLFEKKTGWVPFITFSSGIANVVLNIILIPIIGVVAAAWTTLISYALTFVLAFFIGKKFYAMKWDVTRLLLISAVGLALVLPGVLIPVESMAARLAMKGFILAIATVVIFVIVKTATKNPIELPYANAPEKPQLQSLSKP